MVLIHSDLQVGDILKFDNSVDCEGIGQVYVQIINKGDFYITISKVKGTTFEVKMYEIAVDSTRTDGDWFYEHWIRYADTLGNIL